MARAPTSTQDQPTKPRPVGDNGLVLDGWGLPVNGPSRAAALAGKPDPALADADPTPAPPAEEA